MRHETIDSCRVNGTEILLTLNAEATCYAVTVKRDDEPASRATIGITAKRPQSEARLLAIALFQKRREELLFAPAPTDELTRAKQHAARISRALRAQGQEIAAALAEKKAALEKITAAVKAYPSRKDVPLALKAAQARLKAEVADLIAKRTELNASAEKERLTTLRAKIHEVADSCEAKEAAAKREAERAAKKAAREAEEKRKLETATQAAVRAALLRVGKTDAEIDAIMNPAPKAKRGSRK